jgi:hypothetical protein
MEELEKSIEAVWSELLMVSDEGASPTPVSPVNDESDSDRTLNEFLSSGDSVSLRKSESVNVSSLHWGHSEIFPDTYAIPYRKDRKLGEGGVFTAVDNNYITTEVVSNCNCEIVGTKIN